MQAGLRAVALAAGVLCVVPLYGEAQNAKDGVEPPSVGVSDYIPPENLDPNLMAIQIKRLEDRVLALEQTNERLVDRVRVLTENFNALVEYLKGGNIDQNQ